VSMGTNSSLLVSSNQSSPAKWLLQVLKSGLNGNTSHGAEPWPSLLVVGRSSIVDDDVVAIDDLWTTTAAIHKTVATVAAFSASDTLHLAHRCNGARSQ
jgi:hypothetical protein